MAATGLDYTAVFATLERMFRAKSQDERDGIFSDLQFMESAALRIMAKPK